ncbi:hypothetical protein BK710_23350 [Bacillus thuringiensis serovar sumiyoshiensis]|nr:hypothetical protein [Bacillus thuringiensis]OTW80638.1 hypothetical protein BK710_23350 [Bacillus thuringiensis serovar sumiyoshiensis]OTW91379.1 hypothetical protein BK711_28500 [Bacillus thuringiensis serovar fukuokaensis]PEB11216.1 hypothetical protein COM67_16760 [Bacillus thuringiensis]PEQ56356.1 hypothetical protein CN473_00520 [Bacillus thuringiensis]
MSLGLLFIILSLIFVFKRDTKKLVMLYLFSYIALPANSYIDNLLKVVLFGINSRTIIGVFILILISVSIVRNGNLNLTTSDILFCFTIIFLAIYGWMGYKANNIFLKEDVKVFFNLILVYLILRATLFTSISIKEIIKCIAISSLVYSVIVIYIYIFKQDALPYIYGEKLYFWWGRRVNFTNSSIFILSVPIAIYYIYHNKDKYLYYVVLMLNLGATFLSQTRTLIFLVLINMAFCMLYFMYLKLRDNKVTLISVSKVCFSIMFIMIFCMLLNVESMLEKNSLLKDLQGRFSSETETLDVRTISNDAALEEIKNNVLGYGLGKELILYNDNYTISSVGTFIDNAFVTIGMKLGIIGISVMSLILFFLWVNILRLYIRTKSTIYLMMIVIYPCFIVMTAVMNAQIIYSPVSSLVFVLLFIVFNQRGPLRTNH